MIIRKLELLNIRSYEKISMDFEKGVTVFSGRTGSGKSTVLMALEFALFGSSANFSNASVLRRGSDHGQIVLSFEQGGAEYTIKRGIKRKGSNVGVDDKNLSITRNGQPIPLMARARDLNEKILEILGFPEKGNPVELFQVTSYTRQDEIRRIIGMRPEERQQYIDRTLQISKYQLAYDNLKDVLSYFDKKKENLKGSLEISESFEDELKKDGEELEQIKQRIDTSEKELRKAVQEHEKFFKEISAEEEFGKKILSDRQELDRVLGRAQTLKESIKRMEEELSGMKSVMDGEIEKTDVPQIEKDEKRVETEITLLLSRSAEISKNLNELESRVIGEKKCPLCTQPLTEDLVKKIKKEYEQGLEELNQKTAVLKQKKNRIIELLEKAREQEEKIREREARKIWFEKIRQNLSATCQELEALEEKEKGLAQGIKGLKDFERKIASLREKEKQVYTRKQTLSQEIKLLSSSADLLEKKIAEKQKILEEIKTAKEKVVKINQLIRTISGMRDAIRSIREVVRNKFLEDFRYEFQKKFEEIREGEYSVDIKRDYEPVAFAENEETSIESLSGGEKTSIALSYRLALSEIAARASEMHRTEVLLLDEPTTGFDAEDIKTLPGILRNIESIPQIIIVTHEPELKNAADKIFMVEKKGGVSEITS